ncbi:MAG: GGDEF domain-containing protein [Deltaproteobacteria bacterium]|nr:GGDEF domain-containing protein [Deltaproteobacteria bacterium]MBW2534646.1 GGDEF domain-containing protein [Deltaproteobacteria bacterium]
MISAPTARKLTQDIQGDGWFPLPQFFSLLDSLMAESRGHSSIVFHAGVEFMRQWYTDGPGHTFIRSGVDFLRYQAGSSGYSSVVRGDPEQVGSVELAELDEATGLARIVAINPFPAEFDRGAFYGGVTVPGDMDWVEVTSEETPQGQLTRKDITIRFRKRVSEDWASKLEQLLSEDPEDREAPIPQDLVSTLYWKHRDLRVRHEHDASLLDGLSDILEDTNRKLRPVGTRDELTQLHNRVYMIDAVDHWVNAHDEHAQEGFSVAILALDHFDELRDAWGPDAGSSMLEAVADVLREAIGAADLAIRLEGEEFAVFLKGVDRETAAATGERLRVRIGEIAIAVRSVSLTIKASAGVASHHQGETLDELLQRAERSLREAKSAGGNRVVAAP